MECHACGTAMKALKCKPYAYRDCGLPNVVLTGIDQYKCSSCGELYVAIPKIKQLHRLIGMMLCCKKERLSGEEIRYLRKEMGLRAIDYALLLSIKPETLSRIERGTQSAGETLEKLIRSTFMNLVSGELNAPVGLDIIRFFLHAARLPGPTGKKIRLKPAEWTGILTSPACAEVRDAR